LVCSPCFNGKKKEPTDRGTVGSKGGKNETFVFLDLGYATVLPKLQNNPTKIDNLTV
jgi:hypothetical protein